MKLVGVGVYDQRFLLDDDGKAVIVDADARKMDRLPVPPQSVLAHDPNWREPTADDRAEVDEVMAAL